MKYYVMAIEQTLIDGEYNEYAPEVKKYNDFSSAETYFHIRLGQIANSAAHVFAELKIINSEGGQMKHDCKGKYVDVDANVVG